MRARVERGGERGRVGLKLESGSVGEEDAPDRRGPPGGETGRGGGCWAGSGERASGGNGLRKSFLGCGERKERKWWAGLEVGKGKENVLYFSKAILTLSIQIQTQEFEFKLNNKQIKMQSSMRCTNLFSLYLFYG